MARGIRDVKSGAAFAFDPACGNPVPLESARPEPDGIGPAAPGCRVKRYPCSRK